MFSFEILCFPTPHSYIPFNLKCNLLLAIKRHISDQTHSCRAAWNYLKHQAHAKGSLHLARAIDMEADNDINNYEVQADPNAQ